MPPPSPSFLSVACPLRKECNGPCAGAPVANRYMRSHAMPWYRLTLDHQDLCKLQPDTRCTRERHTLHSMISDVWLNHDLTKQTKRQPMHVCHASVSYARVILCWTGARRHHIRLQALASRRNLSSWLETIQLYTLCSEIITGITRYLPAITALNNCLLCPRVQVVSSPQGSTILDSLSTTLTGAAC